MNAEYKNKKEVNNVVFLESNIKKATIKTFLGSDYEIFATGGHISSLENSGYCNIGVDLDNFSPKYEIIKTKENLVKFWKDYLEKNPKINIFIATDPDREGARIAQELVDILDLKDNYERLFFHEITFNAIKEALENPTKLDFNLIDAQVSREVLDKMIGFCLSSLIQKKINAWSAGRVQSVVLKLIVDREREIMNHVPKVEFLVIASFKIGRKKHKLV
ncbi:MAG TPA: DNA topoisomerase, partial [Mycoplasmatales bacterium]|nr:DNA topoisomerase [Mycoplasmatales bacterium]